MTILILSSASDLHAQAVIAHLTEMGMPVTLWSQQELLDKWRLIFEVSGSGFNCRLRVDNSSTDEDGQPIDLTQFRAVWLRRPGVIKSIPLPEPWMESLAAWESKRALEAIYRMLPCLWVNHPAKENEALLKLRQLELARQCGLAIPETVVTNDGERAAEFYKSCGGELIYKMIDEGSFRYFPAYEVVRGIPTMPFRESDLEHLKQVRLSLHLFQRKVRKACDLRVTVVGSKLFAVEISSQEGKGDLDFRLDYSVPIKTHDLPGELSGRLIDLVGRFGLNFAAIDLCIDETGNYVFFELNPAGQWLWMEKALGVQISLAVARLLAGEDPPLAGEAS